MRDFSGLDDVQCKLRLNGVSVQSVGIRRTTESAGDFDILVKVPLLGAFSLHSGFEIELHEPDANWRRVSLDELKEILNKRNLLPVGDLQKASEIAECRLFAPVDDITIPRWEHGRLSVLGREDACVRYVQRILYRVGIPHLVLGTTFLVPSAATARIPLQRAGFRRSEISRSALVEPRTGCAIQVIERDPRK